MSASAPPPRDAVADRELVFTRVFDAPRALVWQAWADPARVAEWWGPLGFTTTTREHRLAPGGSWRFTMPGPDGRDYPNRVVYREVEPLRRLVYAHDDDGGQAEPIAFEVTVTFEDEGVGTRLTMRMLFPSAAALRRVAEEYGAIEGAHQTLARLAEHLKSAGAVR